MSQIYTVEQIREKLETNDKWLIRGILAIYARQTVDEKSSNTTKHTNGRGFNGRDAGILSSFARQIQQWQVTENPRYRQPLSPKQFGLARKMMRKYAGQLARIAEENNPQEEGIIYESKKVNQDWIQHKNAFAAHERQMEENAYRAEMEAEAAAERAAIMEEERYAEDAELSWS